jgi:hypothetical protein
MRTQQHVYLVLLMIYSWKRFKKKQSEIPLIAVAGRPSPDMATLNTLVAQQTH